MGAAHSPGSAQAPGRPAGLHLCEHTALLIMIRREGKGLPADQSGPPRQPPRRCCRRGRQAAAAARSRARRVAYLRLSGDSHGGGGQGQVIAGEVACPALTSRHSFSDAMFPETLKTCLKTFKNFRKFSCNIAKVPEKFAKFCEIFENFTKYLKSCRKHYQALHHWPWLRKCAGAASALRSVDASRTHRGRVLDSMRMPHAACRGLPWPAHSS